ncbi:MAG TPA: hypothetical protein VJ779_02055 [Acetobacteraceae bacterium]|nr:hypothetical protein [Acetobacteraceae bacterium]
MVNVNDASLEGRLEWIGPVRFIRAQWWDEAPRFALLRFAFEHGEEQQLGLRMDLDKKAILDSIGDQNLDAAIQQQAEQIWRAVVEARDQKMREQRVRENAALY